MPPATDPEIEALDLAMVASTAAYTLKAAHPAVTFTSGRRDVAEQASAMAANIVKSSNRQWIHDTYVQSEVRDACQKWVDDNPGITAASDLADGLESTLEPFSPAKLGKLSKHLSGMAFDVQPIADADGGAGIRGTIKTLPGLDKFIENEGGLTVWHAQFKD